MSQVPLSALALCQPGTPMSHLPDGTIKPSWNLGPESKQSLLGGLTQQRPHQKLCWCKVRVQDMRQAWVGLGTLRYLLSSPSTPPFCSLFSIPPLLDMATNPSLLSPSALDQFISYQPPGLESVHL